MQIKIFTVGTSGDLNPLIGFGLRLKDKGYFVTFLSNDYFCEQILAAGFTYISVGNIEHYRLGNSDESWCHKNIADMSNFEFYHAPSFEPAYKYIESIEDKKNILLITTSEQNGAVVAAKKLGISYIKISLSPNLVYSAKNPPAPLSWQLPKKMPNFLKEFLTSRIQKKSFWAFYENPAAKEYLKTRMRLNCPIKYSRKSDAILQIGFFPEWFGMRAADWPKDLKLVGFPLFDGTKIIPDQTVQKFLAKQPILFTTGTGVPDTTEFFEEGKKLCEILQVPGIFVGGKKGKEAIEGSALCMHVDYIDFEFALPFCKAIVHHGGIGTTAQAIRAGIPQLIRPIKYDQPDNADRIHKLGLGTFVLPDYFKAVAIAPMVKDLLENAVIKKNIQMYSADLKRSSAIEKACNLIEQQINKTLGA